MSSIIYRGEAIYEVQNAEKEQNVHLYVEKQNAEYHCVAYHPENKHIIGHCSFTEILFTEDSAAAKAVEMLQIQHTSIKRINRWAKRIDLAEERDIKIHLLKALAEQAGQPDYESETINNILAIIKML